ncbi:Metallo-hydrolase/oxidoreductase [Lentinula raphanica]|uniref:Metallo-hydrolase/oxidoreductase n=1 Tax=Lentinula raphanica TaxID=153919 RepID=A0AA38PMM1_9AGAR|nr:Metallo-hydrolase/oxidoreductase [Lentinula raphanica]
MSLTKSLISRRFISAFPSELRALSSHQALSGPSSSIFAIPGRVHTTFNQGRRSLTTSSSTHPNSVESTKWKHYKADVGSADIYAFLEPVTSSWQYIVADPTTRDAVVIDPVLDYNPASGTLSTTAADTLLEFIREKNLSVVRILETHAHADHLTASQYIKRMLGGKAPICIGERIKQLQGHFAPVYGLESTDFVKSFDVFLKDEEVFTLGSSISGKVIHLPGHTPDHIGYMIGKAVFTGDSIFMPDLGSARADFPGGNAKDLFSSMTRLLSLPEDYQLFVGHDYPVGREHDCMATVGVHQMMNKHGKLGITESQFIQFREARDKVLGAPRLLHPSLQVNIRAGKLPPASNGRVWLKTPTKLSNPNIPL